MLRWLYPPSSSACCSICLSDPLLASAVQGLKQHLQLHQRKNMRPFHRDNDHLGDTDSWTSPSREVETHCGHPSSDIQWVSSRASSRNLNPYSELLKQNLGPRVQNCGCSWSSSSAGGWPPTGAPRLKCDPGSSGCSRLTNIQIWPHWQTPAVFQIYKYKYKYKYIDTNKHANIYT